MGPELSRLPPGSRRDGDREWRLVTVPWWRATAAVSGHVLLGEVPLRTALPRWIDGVAIKRRGRGDAPPPGPFYLRGAAIDPVERAHWLSQIPRSEVTVIQTKVERVGLSVLGQALVSTALLPDRYPGCRARGVALGTGTDEAFAQVLPAVAPQLKIASYPLEGEPAPPSREYPRAPELLHALVEQLPSHAAALRPIGVTAYESAEAVLTRGAEVPSSAADLRGRDVLVVHTIGKATNLPVVGHAVFAAALLREHEPRSLRSIILAAKPDDLVESVARRYGVETFAAAAVGSGEAARFAEGS